MEMKKVFKKIMDFFNNVEEKERVKKLENILRQASFENELKELQESYKKLQQENKERILLLIDELKANDIDQSLKAQGQSLIDEFLKQPDLIEREERVKELIHDLDKRKRFEDNLKNRERSYRIWLDELKAKDNLNDDDQSLADGKTKG